MKGCRPLTPEEIQAICSNLSLRNRAIFILGIRTGFRISELMSLDVRDVRGPMGWNTTVRVRKQNMKGSRESRIVPLHPEAIEALKVYLGERIDGPLFRSRRGRLEKSVFHRQLKDACTRAGIQDIARVATHSMRKCFSKNFYDACGKDLYLLSKALGHSTISSTVRYLGIEDDIVSEIIRKMK